MSHNIAAIEPCPPDSPLRYRRLAAIGLLSCLVLMLAACGTRQSSEELMQQALAAARAGDWSYAREYARRVTAHDPGNLDARMLMGLSFHYLGETGRATRSMRQVAEQAPNNFTAQFLYGWMLSEAGNFAEALAPLRRAHEIDRHHRPLLVLLARACLEQNLIEGVGYLQRLVSEADYGNRPEAFNAIALLWMGEPNYNRARAFFLQALRRDPGNPVVLQNLAVLYDLYLNDEEQALAYYRRCLATSQRINDSARARQVTERLRQLMQRRRHRQ